MTHFVRISVSILACISLIAPQLVHASDVDASLNNDQTGFNSENINEASVSQDTNITVRNDADVNTDVRMNLNTGGNRVSRNTVVEDVSTGDIDFSLTAQTTANQNQGVPTLSANGGTVTLESNNSLTGARSSNVNTINKDSDTTIRLSNIVNKNQNFTADLNTGNNRIEENTLVGSVRTGNISVDITDVEEFNNVTLPAVTPPSLTPPAVVAPRPVSPVAMQPVTPSVVSPAVISAPSPTAVEREFFAAGSNGIPTLLFELLLVLLVIAGAGELSKTKLYRDAAGLSAR